MLWTPWGAGSGGCSTGTQFLAGATSGSAGGGWVVWLLLVCLKEKR